jgi:hypothetical protein
MEHPLDSTVPRARLVGSEEHKTTDAKHAGLYFRHPARLEHDPRLHMPEHPDIPVRLEAIGRSLAAHDWLGWERREVPPAQETQLEEWLRSCRPEELFDDRGAPQAELAALAPGARDGGDAVVRGETGDQTDQESRSAGHRAAVRVTATDITTTTSGVTMTGSSTRGIKTVLHPVFDLATAKADGAP